MRNTLRNTITGSTQLYGVIGDPIKHTLSPLIHNSLYERLKRHSVYVPFAVSKENLEEAIKGAYALGIKGLNITMPHKRAVFDSICCMDESATIIDAVNTLVYTKEGYKGYNTDAYGLLTALNEENIVCDDKNVAIIGSGGAAYATYAAVSKAKSIHIFNRSLQNARVLTEHMKNYYQIPTFIYPMDEKPDIIFDVVIQTTGVGMGDMIGQMPQCAPYILEGAKAAVDLIYNPKETAFLNYAKSKGIKCMNGFGMLFYQAVRAFELMHGISCDKSEILLIKKEIESSLEV